MELLWQSKAAAAFVAVTVLGNWLVGPADAPVWIRLLVVLAAFLATVVLRHRRALLAAVKMLPRDYKMLRVYWKALRMARKFEASGATAVTAAEENARNWADKTCFKFEDRTWTYREVNEYSNRVARAFQALGVGHGDVVALIESNRIEYICVWLGLAKLGAVTALINRNLRDSPLTHTINVAKAKVVLFGVEYEDAVSEVRDNLPAVSRYLRLSDGVGCPPAADWFSDVVPMLDAQSVDNPVAARPPGPKDPLMYIYTSGTTGLPKAAVISHFRLQFWALGCMLQAGMTPGKDLLYCALPMYHAAAGAYACSLALIHGVPVAFAPKFSASKYWADCARHGATCAQYIGEICRFLVLAPASPHDRQHGVRALVGNGMSPGVWKSVQDKFGVKDVFEFYGSTEGNFMLTNLEGKIGSIGFMPCVLPRSLWPVDLVRVDEDSGELIRDDVSGLCLRCKPGEPGMIVGRIQDRFKTTEFRGYLDRKATDKKVGRDVFSQGDRYFLSGDVAVMDEYGYMYFKDRIGDTYRWKGENVSTAEVETVMTGVLLPFGVRELAAYGVRVPGHEGRPGMAALADPERRADLDVLAKQLSRKLPSYARPLFVRLCTSLPMTGTHKVSKVPLQKEGFDAVTNDDPIFVFDSRTTTYVPLTDAILADIKENRMRI
ncbi:long-chain fatty acid transport protein 4-like [Thrips palmi]|uniref:Long-chain-fatty-acid--CoA ligase n=1 Tax=Thrips palmi TaxID=161013 RepID=A0A6P9AFK2_THRPL|nr:long-chain fatty acid transport protein 4-like [Thrips palmi]